MLRYTVFIFLLLFVACQTTIDEPFCDTPCIPEGFPSIVYPDSNEYTLARWELGKRLFYEKRLSIDTTVSCGTCHQPQHFFTDNKRVSEGVFQRLGERNAPSLANIAYHPYYTREGGVPTLEMQILVPIQEHNEFNHNIVDIYQELGTDSSYQAMAQAAYGRALDPYVITRAIANFERTILSGNSPYDQQFLQGQKNILTTKELAGKDLFFSDKTGCYHCHNDFDFTNYAFANNGLYTNYQDIGRMRVTADSADLALFKVPSLRNVGQTAPYMHDGSMATLEDVINHYNDGGKAHPQKSSHIKPLHLSVEEKENIILFLHTLTDWSLTTNPDYHEN